jgi:hypothetical protein
LSAMISFKNVIQIFRGAVYHILRCNQRRRWHLSYNKRERNSTSRPQSINIVENYVFADHSTSTFSTVKPD